MDEDGQHDPGAIGAMLDTALSRHAHRSSMRSRPTNLLTARFRNVTSRVAHPPRSSWARASLRHFHSFRLVLGEVGRGLAAYCGESVYLDVALTWVVSRTATCPVAMREERGRPSGYSIRDLASHFWRMVLTSGTRPLRLVALFGAFLGIAAFALIGMGRVGEAHRGSRRSRDGRRSWSSCSSPAAESCSRSGIVAEYLGIAARSAMGKPLYLVVSDPARGAARAGQRHPAGSSEDRHSESSHPVEPAARAEGDDDALLDRRARWTARAVTSRASLAARSSQCESGALESPISWYDTKQLRRRSPTGGGRLLWASRPNGRPWRLLWCAGAGVVATPPEALAQETACC